MKKVILMILTILLLIFYTKRTNLVESYLTRKLSFLDSLNLENVNKRKYLIAMDSASSRLSRRLNEASNYSKIEDSMADVNYRISYSSYWQKKNKLDTRDPYFLKKIGEYEDEDSRAMNNLIISIQKISDACQTMIQKAWDNYQTTLEKAKQKYH